MKFIFIRLVLIILFFSTLIGGVKCDYCKKEITGKYIMQDSKSYHEKCYKTNIIPKCNYCLKSLEGKYISLESESYHEKCYKEHIVPKCNVCNKSLLDYYVTNNSGSYHFRYECTGSAGDTPVGGYELGMVVDKIHGLPIKLDINPCAWSASYGVTDAQGGSQKTGDVTFVYRGQ